MVSYIQLLYISTLLTTAILIVISYTTILEAIPYTWRQSEEINMKVSLGIVNNKLSLEEAVSARNISALQDTLAISVTDTGNKITTVDKNLLSYIYKEGHIIPNPDLCPGFGDGVKVVILITTAPDHYEARHGIRLTWGHFGQRSDIALAFVVGTTSNNEVQTKIESESKMYGDIIQGHFVDTYVNLTLKTLSMMEWVGRYCHMARFYLKTDDDMFINVPKLMEFAKEKWEAKRTIYGRLAVGWRPHRDRTSLYYISYEQFGPQVFPTFTTGPAYLVTMDSVQDLYRRTLQHAFVKLEDILITGVVAESLGISRVSAQEFSNLEINGNLCQVKEIISVHKVNYEAQFKLWAKSTSLGRCT